MNVTAISGGTLAVGMDITGPGVDLATEIIAFGSGTGGVGTYLVSPVQTSNPTGAGGSITLTATISGITNPLAVGMDITGPGVYLNTEIIAFVSGTGGVGTYLVTPPVQTQQPNRRRGFDHADCDDFWQHRVHERDRRHARQHAGERHAAARRRGSRRNHNRFKRRWRHGGAL